MKMIWLNFYDVIPNAIREIEFLFKISFFSFIYYKQIQVVWMLEQMNVKTYTGIKSASYHC